MLTNEAAIWDRWLEHEDSPNESVPEGYDDAAALARVKALRQRLISALAAYEVQTSNPDWYQDGTGLVGFRVTAKGDLGPFATALAWILLSRFGILATVKGCDDPELLAQLCGELEHFGLKYIPYEYLAGKTYDGKCKALVGFSWANRYFSLVADHNSEASRDDGG
jgi:hypothetical protein